MIHSLLKGNRKVIVSVGAITVVSVLTLRYFHSTDLANQIGFIGLAVAVWQMMEQSSGAETTAKEAKEKQLMDAIALIKEQCEERDRVHDKLIAQLRQDFTEKIGIFATQIENHSNQFGHAGTIEELFKLKDKLSEVQAALAAHTRIGEALAAISRIQKDVEALKSKTENIV